MKNADAGNLNLGPFPEGKFSKTRPPGTSQSSHNPLYPDFRLQPDFVDCMGILWIAESIAEL